MFKILVVEDDAQLNKSVCTYLEQNGYEPFECLSAEEAYDAMYGGAVFDMIISDIMMPDIDGFEFAETVREVNSEIPILFMTARDDFASKQKGFRAGIDDYMVKPVDLDELLLRIGVLLRRARIAAEKKARRGKTHPRCGRTCSISGREGNIPYSPGIQSLYKLLSYPKKNLHSFTAHG